jgi:cellulose synthase/poly-beta-1,6-N-acetylglucosamine synthase-like glycosyltransferase
VKATRQVDQFHSETWDEMPGNGSQLLQTIAGELSAGFEQSSKTGVVDHIRAARSAANIRLSACIDRLHRLGIETQVINAALKRTEMTGSWLIHELISEGSLRASTYFQQLARDLGIDYSETIDDRRIVKEASPPAFRVGRTAQVCCRQRDGGLVIYTAPDSMAETVIAETLRKFPAKAGMFRIVEPATVQSAFAKLRAQQIAENASTRLYMRTPHMSAKFTLVSWQAFFLGVFSLGVPSAFLLWPEMAFAFLHIFVIATFTIAIATRLAAFYGIQRGNMRRLMEDTPESTFPMYSVLVALHKEAAVAPQIVRSMSRLVWPQSRLEVIYICEEDDHETQEALAKLQLPASHRILAVPPIGPRTKPKALNFALDQCSGEFVVIYDAEDRPDPMQLREAWQRFAMEGLEVACLQAPLLVSNARSGWLSCLFAAEYTCHFYALLPFLDQQGAPLPLGGTSNHFRREALEKIGAWDPYNVTEDADLGIRLTRHGYRSSVIGLPTLEDAPEKLSEWIPQRTRWIKGWMQTFLVHNRDIHQLYNNIGGKNFVLFEILMISFILSPLLYIISIISFGIIFFDSRQISVFLPNLFYWDIAVFVAGHLSQFFLSAASWRKAFGTRIPMAAAMTFPGYWVLANFAACRAVWKLVRSPFEWEKTSHRPVRDHGEQPRDETSGVSKG